MPMDAFEEDIARPFGVAARGSIAANGFSIFAYSTLTTAGTTNLAVPAGAKALIAHVVGGGGTGFSDPTKAAGGGAAYSQSDAVPVSASSNISATVGNAQTAGGTFPQDGTASSVSVNGTVIALAEQGYAAKSGVPGRGGLAANGIGKIRRSGGTGGTASVSSTPAEGGDSTIGLGLGGNSAGNFGAPAGGLGENNNVQGQSTSPGGGGGYSSNTAGAVGRILLQWLR